MHPASKTGPVHLFPEVRHPSEMSRLDASRVGTTPGTPSIIERLGNLSESLKA